MQENCLVFVGLAGHQELFFAKCRLVEFFTDAQVNHAAVQLFLARLQSRQAFSKQFVRGRVIAKEPGCECVCLQL